jgi:isoleucyl-tRNA synthetase
LGRADPRVLRRAKGEPILDAQIVRNAADLIEKHGSNVWFEKSVSRTLGAREAERLERRRSRAKSNDTLDVWIDSGSSARSCGDCAAPKSGGESR